MSRVSIEIDGLKLGLRIKGEIALKLVGALQAYWVANRLGRSTGKELIECDEAFDRLVENVAEAARRHPLEVVNKS